MVFAGHSNATIAGMFAVGGMGISLLAGLLYAALTSERPAKALAAGGAEAGGTCALIGILFSFAMGDVPAMILVVGTLSSAITGALGGLRPRFAKSFAGCFRKKSKRLVMRR